MNRNETTGEIRSWISFILGPVTLPIIYAKPSTVGNIWMERHQTKQSFSCITVVHISSDFSQLMFYCLFFLHSSSFQNELIYLIGVAQLINTN